MNMFSLRTIVDDILLLVRNNNISESEDLSRDLIRAWVLAYKANILKTLHDKDKETGDDTDSDDSLSITIGPVDLKNMVSQDSCCAKTKRTKEKLPPISGDSNSDIINVITDTGCVILNMNQSRRHYHFFRRYTSGEPCFYYDDGYVYIQGHNIDNINKIYITGNFTGGDDDTSEDDVQIPGWMIPTIKELIMLNELSFMLNRPSDDSNNSTLASIKPNGPQDKEK